MGVNDDLRAPAVRRAVAVLEMLALRGAAASADLARELGIAKSSTSDLVSTLLVEGFAKRRGDELAVGPLLGRLTAGFVGDEDILTRFDAAWPRHPLLAEHTVSVQSIVGIQNLCVDARLGRYLLPYTPRAGSRTDLWTGTAGEPVLRCLPAAAVKHSLEAFAGFHADTDLDGLDGWLDEHGGGGQRAPLPSLTGNLELSAAVATGDPDAPPVALSLHLPPARAGEATTELSDALHELATAIGN